jgi:transketolase
MLSLPGLDVWAPGDCADVELAIRSILAAPAPTYLRCPRTPIDDAHGLPGAAAELRWLRPRRPVCLISTGVASHWALAAAGRLAEAGLEVGVLHCLRLRPLPALADQLRGVRAIFAIDDHVRFGGLGSLLHDLELAIPITTLGWPDEFSGKSGDDAQLLAAHGLSAERLAHRIEAALAARPGE